MIDINWSIFEANFSENKEKAFEKFCYMLFCIETDNLNGIKRYERQAAIETEPVEYNGETIGFQCKYLNKKITLDQIEEIIKDTKIRYPNITKLLIYMLMIRKNRGLVDGLYFIGDGGFHGHPLLVCLSRESLKEEQLESSWLEFFLFRQDLHFYG